MNIDTLLAKLNSDGRSLHNEVRDRYGSDIQYTVEHGPNPFRLGIANVSDVGVPWIYVNLDSVDPVVTLVHELFHLKLRWEGEPSIFEFTQTANRRFDPQHFEIAWKVTQDVRDFVSHAVFFDSMRAIGYEPSMQYDADLRSLIARNPAKEITHPIQQSLIVARSRLECSESSLVSHLEGSYAESTVELGVEIADVVLSCSPSDGQTMASCVARCADMALKSINSGAALHRLVQQPKGSYFVDRIAVLALRNTSP